MDGTQVYVEATLKTGYSTLDLKKNNVTINSGTTHTVGVATTISTSATANTYTLTADANGGSIPSTNGWTGIGNTLTTSVVYDSMYGTLPTPGKTGYTFLGWNGKNLY